MIKPQYILKKDPVISFVTVLFGGWMVLLGIVSGQARSSVFIYDYLNHQDLTNVYGITLPLGRYLLEPFCGISATIGYSFDYLFIALFFYLGLRFFYLIAKRLKGDSLKINPFILCVKDALFFFSKFFILFLFLSLGYLGILWKVQGFVQVANQFSKFLFWTAVISITLFWGRFLHNIILLVREKGARLVKKRKEKGSAMGKFIRFSFHELWVMFSVIFLVLASVVCLISTHLPTQRLEIPVEYNEEGQQGEYLIDFHVHTRCSDGYLTPEQRVDWYIAQGVDGAAFSDHHNTCGAKRAQAYVEKNNLDFMVILAQEFTDDPEGLHLNIYGIEQDITPKDYFGNEGEYVFNCEEMIKWVKNNSGYVTVNHYGPNATETFTYNQLMEWGVDGFEIVNYGEKYPEEQRQFCLDNDLACMGGSDIHGNNPLNTVVKIRLDPNNLSLDAIFTQLKKNEHEVLQLVPHEGRITGLEFDFYDFANYFLGLDRFQLLSWWLWSFIFYFGFIGFYSKIRKNKIGVHH